MGYITMHIRWRCIVGYVYLPRLESYSSTFACKFWRFVWNLFVFMWDISKKQIK